MKPREILESADKARREAAGIYMIHCEPSDKCYVGQSINIASRIKTHRGDLRRGKHFNSYLQAAWNKYGEEAFTFFALENCERSQLNPREEFWVCCIDRDRLFNLGDVGNGYPRTAEHCRRISVARRGQPRSAEHCRKISEAHKGRPARPKTLAALKAGLLRYNAEHDRKALYTPEVRAKLSAAKQGWKPTAQQLAALSEYARKPKTEETKRKISLAQKGRPAHPNSIAGARASNIGRSPWNKGKPLTEAHKAALREGHRRRKEKGVTP